MKRSKKAALFLMVPTATFLLAGCGERDVDAVVYSSPRQCEQHFPSVSEWCWEDYREAQGLHSKVAPKYMSYSSCEADFGVGNCEVNQASAPNRSNTYMPMMMGYMASSMIDRSSQLNSGVKSLQAQPLYKSRDDKYNFRTASNNVVSNVVGATKVKPSLAQPRAGRFTARGGFGAQAAMRSAGS